MPPIFITVMNLLTACVLSILAVASVASTLVYVGLAGSVLMDNTYMWNYLIPSVLPLTVAALSLQVFIIVNSKEKPKPSALVPILSPLKPYEKKNKIISYLSKGHTTLTSVLVFGIAITGTLYMPKPLAIPYVALFLPTLWHFYLAYQDAKEKRMTES
jgi:hypothetical protein